jgi:hypothetical protein
VFKIEAIAIELLNPRSGRHNAVRITELDNIQGVEECLENRRCKTVVGGRREREKVDSR